ncbi:hypothetical protein HMPREF1982_04620 [Clostridiales bacterium oral taxon 876 str. F0540]|nr:hypothetical protein HMPREF1982_04620 [Clostridiales bacterium oral taxon 876 str. F0540]
MKLKSLAALLVAVSVSTGVSVHAAVLPAADMPSQPEKKVEMKEQKEKSGHHGGMFRAAKEMGITKEEMKEARQSGKNFFELAKQKGFNEQQAKDMIIKNKTAAIDEKVKEGKITKEKGEEIKTNMKEKISKWDGEFKDHKDKDHKDIKQENKEEKED